MRTIYEILKENKIVVPYYNPRLNKVIESSHTVDEILAITDGLSKEEIERYLNNAKQKCIMYKKEIEYFNKESSLNN